MKAWRGSPQITGMPVLPLDPAHGLPAERGVALIDEAWCIGCTLCIAACPVDAIVGSAKLMHTVIEADCTGCELCIPVCPVDCISLPSVTPGRSGWTAWSEEAAGLARQRYQARQERLAREALEQQQRALPVQPPDKRAAVEAALARARAKAK